MGADTADFLDAMATLPAGVSVVTAPEGGDHRVVVGRVRRTAVDEDRDALAYYRRGFVPLVT
jgi:flavin reductase (DIM6/NTAB) family NADH-FMN oxidoreductase RutF